MLDHFDSCCRLVIAQAFVPVHKRSLKKRETLCLARRQTIHAQAVARDLERAGRYIHSADSSERPIFHQITEQSSFAAAKVNDLRSAVLLQNFDHSSHPLLVKADFL